MKEGVDKSPQQKLQTPVAPQNEVSDGGEQLFQFKDKRAETKQAFQLQDMANSYTIQRFRQELFTETPNSQFSSNPIVQLVTIDGKPIKAFQLQYLLFKEQSEGLLKHLETFDDESFKTEGEFIEAFLEKFPTYREIVDERVLKDKAKEHRLKAREEQFREAAKRTPEVPKKAKVDADAINHSWERHTIDGIKHVKAIKSATEGDSIAVFPDDYVLDSIKKIASEIESQPAKLWANRPKGGVYADFEIDGMTIRVYAVSLGPEVSAETFFPMGREKPRVELENLFK